MTFACKLSSSKNIRQRETRRLARNVGFSYDSYNRSNHDSYVIDGKTPLAMEKTKFISNDVELPSLRSLDDFLLESTRFQLPNLRDYEKWGNRLANNLLYYQTNYLLLSVVIFLIVGLIHPIKMLVGMLAMVVVLAVFVYVSMEGRAIHQFKKQYPMVGVLFIVLAGCFVTYTLGSLIVFLLGILLPFCVTFVHASLRLRNIKNKIANKVEGIGLKRTPMGVFLRYLGMEDELFA